MSPPVQGVIDQVIIQPSKIQPIIVNFQNGALRDEETCRMECGIYHDTKKEKTVLAMSNGRVVYKGYRPDSDKELTYTMLAIRNKKTGKIRLIQAERWQVAPVLERQAETEQDKSIADQIGALNKQFGSKKIKRRTEQHERMKINIDSAKEQLEKSVSNVKIDRADLSSTLPGDDNAVQDQMPRCNREASNPRDVYNVYDIVPEDILKSLYEKIDEILEDTEQRKSRFYAETLKRLASDAKMTKKIAILEYMESVRAWFDVPLKDVKKRNLEIYKHSATLNNHIIETYSLQGANGRQRPNSMKHKGIIHCMILALIVSQFTLDMDLFMSLFTSIRIGVKKFTDFARLIGAVPTKENKKIFVLKVPLPPPLSAVRKGRKQ